MFKSFGSGRAGVSELDPLYCGAQFMASFNADPLAAILTRLRINRTIKLRPEQRSLQVRFASLARCSRSVYLLAAQPGLQDMNVAQLRGGNGQHIGVEQHQVRELARFDRSLVVFLELRIG